MAVSRAETRVHCYISGWCEAALHYRCKGSYAGTACCCSCHQLVQTVHIRDMM